MYIRNLIENTEGIPGCVAEHGLSFYIETEKHKLLMDLGPSEETVRNAEKLGIDLKAVDTVVLSHGHYDHSGGILAFAGLNPKAAIWIQQTAAGEYYADEGPNAEDGRFRYIGIDKRICELPQLKTVRGDFVIDEELRLFTIPDRVRPLPFTNRSILIQTTDGYTRDEFQHEQCLVVAEGGTNVLLSGCAHNGIVNILETYKKKFGSEPDLVISGFHLMKKTEYRDDQLKEIRETAEELKNYRSRFITCHCTGLPAYEIMKNIMGDQLEYVHSGEEIQ